MNKFNSHLSLLKWTSFKEYQLRFVCIRQDEEGNVLFLNLKIAMVTVDSKSWVTIKPRPRILFCKVLRRLAKSSELKNV